jgi:S-formylglutathione hydrolase
MTFAIWLPAGASKDIPVAYWLSGLTCTDLNFIEKANAFGPAAEHQIAIVCPDTSPDALGIDGENDGWDFGTKAGFYVNATEPKWKENYNMYDYVTKELPELVRSNFGISATKQSIMGHSMGGHGALVAALKNPGAYKSVSAFAPIVNPTNCAWGHKAFTGYLGSVDAGKEYDATLLVAKYAGPQLPILIDQGSADSFMTDPAPLGQLQPDNFKTAVDANKPPVTLELNMRDGYDHSYYFIATFIRDHIAFHAKALKA